MQQLTLDQARPPGLYGGKIKLLSLGGCITHDACKYADCFALTHVNHLWRRPTIPLVAKAPAKFPFLDESFSPDIARYWQDDFRKTHYNEVFNSDANVLVFDITRDILCRILEVEEFSYVIDPMSVKGLLWNNETLDEAKILKTLGKECRSIGFQDDTYFDTWKFMFDRFVDRASRFECIILNKIYFTTRQASQDPLPFGDALHARSVNEFLDRMYDYIKDNHSRIKFCSVPSKLLITGFHVSWSGPTYTHFISEATSMYAENIRKIVLGDAYQSGEIFIKNALTRANQHEDLTRSYFAMCAERDVVATERDGLQSRLAETDGDRVRLTSELGSAAEERDTLRSRLFESEHHRDQLAAMIGTITHERDASAASRAEVAVQRDNLTAELHTISNAYGMLQARLFEVESQRDRLTEGVGLAAGERDALREAFDTRQAEDERQRDRLATELRLAAEERDALREAFDARHAEDERQRDHLATELRLAAEERDALRDRLAEAEKQGDYFKTLVEYAVAEGEMLKGHLSDFEAKTVRLANDLGVAESERDALRSRSGEIEQTCAVLAARLDSMTNERNSLQNRVTEFEDHRDDRVVQQRKPARLSFLRL